MWLSGCTKLAYGPTRGFGRIRMYLCTFLPCSTVPVGAPLLAHYTPSLLSVMAVPFYSTTNAGTKVPANQQARDLRGDSLSRALCRVSHGIVYPQQCLRVAIRVRYYVSCRASGGSRGWVKCVCFISLCARA